MPTVKFGRWLSRLHLLLVFLHVPETAYALDEPRHLYARRVEAGAISVDGKADEGVWKLAQPAGHFTQQNPSEGAAPSEPTVAYAACDDRALYFFIHARDSLPDEIRALLTQRDIDSPSDWVEVWLNPQNDRQTGYRFAVNARGVQLDSRLSQSGAEEEVNWHAVWTSATFRTKDGWTAEIRIPFSELRFVGTSEMWGVQIIRKLGRENEISTLEPIPKAASRPLLHLAQLKGLSPLPPAGRVQFRPYGLVSWEKFGSNARFVPRAGGDVRLTVTSATTLHVTALPDFGQVEQDPSQLNLSAFEIFQQERRQFFLDGRENLELRLSYNEFFNDHLYYSRRIGAPPQVELDYERDQIEDYPRVTTIVGAAKVVGRTPRGLNFSMLNAVTQGEAATLELRGVSARAPVAPPTSYNVARVRQEVQGGRGFVGAVGTYTHRFVDEFLRSEFTDLAAVGGAEFDLRFGDYGLMGQALGSHISGTSETVDKVQRSPTNNRKRPDAGHVDYDPTQTSLDGYGIALAGGKFDGSPWRAYWGGHARSSGFNTNDLGFLRTADYIQYSANVQYRFDEPTRLTRFAEVGGGVWLDKTTGAEVTSLGGDVGTEVQLRDNSWINLGFYVAAPALDTSRLRGGPAILRPHGAGSWWGYSTDTRRKWDLGVYSESNVTAGQNYRQMFVETTANIRPIGSLEFSIIPRFDTFTDDLQYVATEEAPTGDEYIVGRVDAQAYSLTLRANWALALGLTLRAYAQPFLTSGRFSQFYLVTDPKAQEYQERRSPIVYDADRSFLETMLRSTVVLRWDFLPGSSAYLAWTREQGYLSSDSPRVVPLRDARNLLASSSSDVVVIKVEWFSLD